MDRIGLVVLVVVLASCHDDQVAQTSVGDSSGGSTATLSTAATATSTPGATDASDATGPPASDTTAAASSGDTDSGLDTQATFGTDVCGDGDLDPGEECDDGNRVDGDACSAECTLSFEVVWTATHAGPAGGFDEARAVVVGDDDALYVLGRRGTADNDELWLGQYAADGTEGWTFTWDGVGGLGAIGSSLAWTESGHLAIVGATQNAAGEGEILVAEFDPASQSLVWSQAVAGPGLGIAVALDPDGNIVAAGRQVVGGTDNDAWIGELSPQGDLVWQQTWDGAGMDADVGIALVVDDAGAVTVLAQTIADGIPEGALLTFAGDGVTTGTPMPDLGDPWTGSDMVADAPTGVLVLGQSAFGLTVWYLDTGWAITDVASTGVPPVIIPRAIALDLQGRPQIAGQEATPGAPDAWVGGFDESGALRWSDAYDNRPAHEQETWNDIAVDTQGDVIVVGNEDTTGDHQFDIIVRKYHVY